MHVLTISPIQVAHEIVNNRWEVAITMSDRGFSQVSFVNSINTIKVCYNTNNDNNTDSTDITSIDTSI